MNDTTKINNEIDYENMDDLPISDHFEWQYIQEQKTIMADITEEETQDEWLAA